MSPKVGKTGRQKCLAVLYLKNQLKKMKIILPDFRAFPTFGLLNK